MLILSSSGWKLCKTSIWLIQNLYRCFIYSLFIFFQSFKESFVVLGIIKIISQECYGLLNTLGRNDCGKTDVWKQVISLLGSGVKGLLPAMWASRTQKIKTYIGFMMEATKFIFRRKKKKKEKQNIIRSPFKIQIASWPVTRKWCITFSMSCCYVTRRREIPFLASHPLGSELWD